FLQDFALALSTLCRGNLEDRLRWLFHLYDQDGDGRITRHEVANMVVAVYGLMGKWAFPPIDDAQLMEKVDNVFHDLDTNSDGVITIDEFVSYCSSDETIMRSLQTLDFVI
ncbi:unnamed protein product, partial [Cyprideis torosa]